MNAIFSYLMHKRFDSARTPLFAPGRSIRPCSKKLLAIGITIGLLFLLHSVPAKAESAPQMPAEPLRETPSGVTPYRPSEPPTGLPPSGPIKPPAHPAGEAALAEDYVRIRADKTRAERIAGTQDEWLITGEGNVTGWYRDVTVTSDRAIANTQTGMAVFEGNVVFYFQGQVAHGERLIVNTKTRQWQVESARATINPDFIHPSPGAERRQEIISPFVGLQEIGPLIQAPLFLSGSKIFGEETREIAVTAGAFTTCNLEPPHYSFQAREITIYPDRKLIAQKVTFEALGHKLVTLPRIAVPLRQIQGRAEIVPHIGQSAEEGYYLRTSYNYRATRQNTGIARLDLMSRKGIAQALTHRYNFAKAAGEIYLYHLNDRNRDLSSLTGRLTHRQELGTVLAEFSTDFRDGSYLYSPNSRSTTYSLGLSRDRPRADSRLDFRQSISSGFGGLGSFETISSTFRHDQRFGERTVLSLQNDLSESRSPQFTPGGSRVKATSGQMNSQVELERRGKSFDLGISANWITNLNDEEFFGSRFAGIERQPELMVRTDAFRLGTNLSAGRGASLGLTLGRYREEPANIQTERALFEMRIPQNRYGLRRNLDLGYDLGFRQYVYGDGTAQYALGATAALEWKIGKQSKADLTYRYLRPRGFTPFRFDFVGEYNVLNASLNLRESERFRLNILGGYDFRLESNKWQDIALRIFYSPNARLGVYTSTGYDINRSRLRDIINQFRIRYPNGLKMDIGTRYSTMRDKFAFIKAQIDTPIGRLWRLQGVAGYNGLTNAFDYRSIMITRDLHCWEASLIYTDQSSFFQRREIRLNLRIKAFPVFEQFGVGAFGQSLDTSVGDVY